MRCDDLTPDLLLDPASERDPLVRAHLADCADCQARVRVSDQLDVALRASVLLQPPADLRASLRQIALSAARPQPAAQPTPPWFQRFFNSLGLNGGLLQPRLVMAQMVAALAVVLAGFQVFQWGSALHPVVGNVPYALEIVAASPAVAYLGGGQIDVGSLAIWSAVGLAAFSVSESGPVNRLLSRWRV